ncbi:predicted protein [Postia placenta Mad-698-R]|nr:predicted protein [Postia placenta Mad-698-R]
MPSALILIADGTEEMEFTITYDTLVRAGIVCTSAYVPAQDAPEADKTALSFATCSRGLKIVPDTLFSPQAAVPEHYDLLVVPGGAKGAQTIAQSVPDWRTGTAFPFALTLVELLCGAAARAEVAGPMVFPAGTFA